MTNSILTENSETEGKSKDYEPDILSVIEARPCIVCFADQL